MFNITKSLNYNKLLLWTNHFRVRQFTDDVPIPSFKSQELYELAVEKLNCMSNAVQKSQLNRVEVDPKYNIKDTAKLLECIGIKVDDLPKLKVIHVGGTKGKGSTCMLTEQLLKSLGFKTGFFSSPHMFKVNERIRIDGMPISDDSFARFFWQLYWPAIRQRAQENEPDTPNNFNFLTAMAFHIFLEERVDVAIVETGFGGKYDATNVLPLTKTVGITNSYLDQTPQLGNKLTDIAWHNSGIIKENSHVFINEQPPECMESIMTVANELNAKLQIVPKFNAYKWNTPMRLNTSNNIIQALNASLAIQLSYNWIFNYKDTIPHNILNKVAFLFTNPTLDCATDVPDEFISPLQTCYWPGRYQILNLGNKSIYFDCGNSCESIKTSTEWFQNSARQNQTPRCLIFSSCGTDDDVNKSLTIFYDHMQLDLIYFTPNYSYANEILLNDNSTNLRGAYESQLSKCYELLQIWHNIRNTSLNYNETKIFVMPCISSCFDNLNELYKNGQIDILVIGSFNLVGETLKYLNQNKF